MHYRLASSSPDVHIVELRGREAAQLGHLTRHRVDLDFAAGCLDEAYQAPEHGLLRNAMWQCALVNFFKCFYKNRSLAAGGRERLMAEDVVPANHPLRVTYDLFDVIRGQHVAHDEGTYMAGQVSVALFPNGRGGSQLQLLTSAGSAGTDGKENLDHFKALLLHTRNWVERAWSVHHGALLARATAIDATHLRSVTWLKLE